MHYKDSLNLLKKITLKKALNSFLLWWSYHQSKYAGYSKLKGKPISIAIEPTTSCNLRCPECPSGLRSFSRPVGMLKADTFENMLLQLKEHLIYMLFYFQGEPYVNKNFLDLVKVASKHNIYTATSTNAHFLDDEIARKTVESGLDRLIISIDGATQETYEAYRIGGKLEKVLEGTRNVVKWKKELKSSTPHIIFQFLVVKPNEQDIPEIYKLADQLGVDEVKLKTAQIYDYKNGSPLIPKNPKYSRYKKMENGLYAIKNKLLNQCWKMWHSCVVTWDGRVVPCCFDKDASHQLGNLNQSSFKSIWEGREYEDFRNKLLKSRSEIDICTNCTEGTKVWAEE
ncbi:MAG: radical SAM protein [Bacteroidetes bacterium]|jgi:radical SAM protein with 4Fe4S-binding SPASM domain|nr:MAG: radical SAM protein [Bacteroidota bacterium]